MSRVEKLLTFSNICKSSSLAPSPLRRVLALVLATHLRVYVCVWYMCIIIKYDQLWLWPWLVGLISWETLEKRKEITQRDAREEVWPTTHVTPIGLEIKIVFHMPRCHPTGQARLGQPHKQRATPAPHRPTTSDHAYPLAKYVQVCECVCVCEYLCNSWQRANVRTDVQQKSLLWYKR